jgi:hypothetical protein
MRSNTATSEFFVGLWAYRSNDLEEGPGIIVFD